MIKKLTNEETELLNSLDKVDLKIEYTTLTGNKENLQAILQAINDRSILPFKIYSVKQDKDNQMKYKVVLVKMEKKEVK